MLFRSFGFSQISGLNLSTAHSESLLVGLNETAENQNDAFTVAQNFSWKLTIGKGITRTIGTLSEYTSSGVFAYQDDGLMPAGPGAGAGLGINDGSTTFVQNGGPCGHIRKLEVPLIFPPLVNVDISASASTFLQLQQVVSSTAVGSGAINVHIRMVLRGYLLTMPVG